jgi:hypothetical protein
MLKQQIVDSCAGHLAILETQPAGKRTAEIRDYGVMDTLSEEREDRRRGERPIAVEVCFGRGCGQGCVSGVLAFMKLSPGRARLLGNRGATSAAERAD